MAPPPIKKKKTLYIAPFSEKRKLAYGALTYKEEEKNMDFAGPFPPPLNKTSDYTFDICHCLRDIAINSQQCFDVHYVHAL